MVAQSATVGTVVTSATGGSQVTTSPPFGASDKIVKPFCNFRQCKDIDFGNLLPEALLEAFDKAQQEIKEDTAKKEASHKHP